MSAFQGRDIHSPTADAQAHVLRGSLTPPMKAHIIDMHYPVDPFRVHHNQPYSACVSASIDDIYALGPMLEKASDTTTKTTIKTTINPKLTTEGTEGTEKPAPKAARKLTRREIIAILAGPPDDHHVPNPTLMHHLRGASHSAACAVGGILMVAVMVPLSIGMGVAFVLGWLGCMAVRGVCAVGRGMVRLAKGVKGRVGKMVDVIKGRIGKMGKMIKGIKGRKGNVERAMGDTKVQGKVKGEGEVQGAFNAVPATPTAQDNHMAAPPSLSASTSSTSPSSTEDILTPALDRSIQSVPSVSSDIVSAFNNSDASDPFSSPVAPKAQWHTTRVARTLSLSLSQAMAPIESAICYAQAGVLDPAFDITSPFCNPDGPVTNTVPIVKRTKVPAAASAYTAIGMRSTRVKTNIFTMLDVGPLDIGPFVRNKARVAGNKGQYADRGEYQYHFGSRLAFGEQTIVVEKDYSTGAGADKIADFVPAHYNNLLEVAHDTSDQLDLFTQGSAAYTHNSGAFYPPKPFTRDGVLASHYSTGYAGRHRILEHAPGIVLDYEERMARIHPDANRLFAARRI